MNINSRNVHFFEIDLETISRDERVPSPPKLPIVKVLSVIAPLINNGYELSYSATPIEVTQARWIPSLGELHLLLNKPDPERSDVAYKKRRHKARRMGDKQKDEDIEVSSHIVIKADDSSSRAKMLITIGAKIPPAKIVALLTKVYRDNSNVPALVALRSPVLPTSVLDGSGKAQRYKVSHRFSLRAMPNQTLREIVANGKIVGLNLISTGSERLDSTYRVNVDRLEMHVELRAQKQVDVPFVKGVINSAFKSRKFEADKIEIEYTDVELTNDSSLKKKRLEVSKLEEAFTRSEKIVLDNPHFDHQVSISDEIIDKMRNLL